MGEKHKKVLGEGKTFCSDLQRRAVTLIRSSDGWETPAASLSAGLLARDGVEDACSWHQGYPHAQAGPPVPKLGMKRGPEAQQLSAGLAPANADSVPQH